MNKHITLRLCMLVATLPLFQACSTQPVSTIEGISRLSITDPHHIEVVDAKSGDGRALSLIADGNIEDRCIVSPGESFSLSDHRHVYIEFKLLRIEGDTAVLKENATFNAVSFGDGLSEKTRTISIQPYHLTGR